jgi:hypothetical protein
VSVTNDEFPVRAWVRGPATDGFRPVRVTHLRRQTISHVVSAEDVSDSPADLPAKETAERRLSQWREREADHAHAEHELPEAVE